MDSPRSCAERLFSAVANQPEKPAIVFEGRTWTFGDCDILSASYARGLSAAGIGPGDRVAVFAETCPEVIIALLGHYRLGAIHVPINTRYRGEEVAHILEDSGARAVLLRAGSSCARPSCWSRAANRRSPTWRRSGCATSGPSSWRCRAKPTRAAG